jgi:hypothetical protein
MKRIINGCEIEWASERVFAALQDHPSDGYLFEVSADQKRIVKCVHISPARARKIPSPAMAIST